MRGTRADSDQFEHTGTRSAPRATFVSTALIATAVTALGCLPTSQGLPPGCVDEDEDGYPAGAECSTEEPLDCDDQDPDVRPDADETCNLADDNCDGRIDDGCPWECGDGVATGSYEECDGSDDGACPGLCSSHCACPAQPPGDLEIHMIDVGQGDAFVIVSPDGFVMAVDAGPSGSWPDLSAALLANGFIELDYTLVSHLHADHLGGMDDLLFLHDEVVTCFDHGGEYDTEAAGRYVTATRDRRVKLTKGDTIDLGHAIHADVLRAGQGADENLKSVVLRLTYGDHAVLMGGDCETSGCEQYLETGPIDVYKVHHHGSSGASSKELLDQMQPSVALISSGGEYGHPHQETLERLAEVGAEIWRTDQDGDVLVVLDGEEISVSTP